ncbi:MAG: recombinase family protein [Myxococcaceae bacterium]|nr:recombinase family protein [Myxococcaceae bacterium]
MKAIYVRTSVSDADGAAQLHQLRHAAKARGWTDWKEYVDIGVSGAKASRPALDELRGAVRRGEVTEAMTTELSRWARDLRHLLLLLDELAAGSCAVIVLREGIDLTTPTGKLMTAIFGALAEFERSLIRQRITAGISKVKATGKSRSGRPLGRPRRAVDLARLAELRGQGLSWRECAVSMKVPRRTLERAFAMVAQNPPSKSTARSPRKRAA